VPFVLSGVDAATFDPAVIAAVLAAALSAEPGTLRVVVDHVSGVAFSLALQGARSLSAPGMRVARSTLALALGVAEESVELETPQSTTPRRRSALNSSSANMTLRVAVSDLQASVQAAMFVAAAAASPQTAARLAASLASEGVSGVTLVAPPTIALVLAVSSPGVTAALLAAQLNANTAVLDAALHAAGLLAVIVVTTPQVPLPPLSPARMSSPPPLPSALTTLPPGAVDSPQTTPVVLITAVVCAIAGVAACAAGAVFLRRRSARSSTKAKQACKRMIIKSFGCDDESDGDIVIERRTVLERTEADERARGDVLLHAVSNVMVMAHDDSTQQTAQLATPPVAPAPSPQSTLLGTHSLSLPPLVSHISTPLGDGSPPPTAAGAPGGGFSSGAF
jgi:hypothetical protein